MIQQKDLDFASMRFGGFVIDIHEVRRNTCSVSKCSLNTHLIPLALLKEFLVQMAVVGQDRVDSFQLQIAFSITLVYVCVQDIVNRGQGNAQSHNNKTHNVYLDDRDVWSRWVA